MDDADSWPTEGGTYVSTIRVHAAFESSAGAPRDSVEVHVALDGLGAVLVASAASEGKPRQPANLEQRNFLVPLKGLL